MDERGRSYRIPVWSGILEKKHRRKISNAIWEFLALIDMTTSEFVKDGVTWGRVMGHKPLTYKEIAKHTGASQGTVKRHIEHLHRSGYIHCKRTAYGLIITVKNSKKRGSKTAPSGKRDRADLTGDGADLTGDRAKVLHLNEDSTGTLKGHIGRLSKKEIKTRLAGLKKEGLLNSSALEYLSMALDNSPYQSTIDEFIAQYRKEGK